MFLSFTPLCLSPISLLFLHFLSLPPLLFTPSVITPCSSSFTCLLPASFSSLLSPDVFLTLPSITFSLWYTAVRCSSRLYRTDPIRIQYEGGHLLERWLLLVSSCSWSRKAGRDRQTDGRQQGLCSLFTGFSLLRILNQSRWCRCCLSRSSVR